MSPSFRSEAGSAGRDTRGFDSFASISQSGNGQIYQTRRIL